MSVQRTGIIMSNASKSQQKKSSLPEIFEQATERVAALIGAAQVETVPVTRFIKNSAETLQRIQDGEVHQIISYRHERYVLFSELQFLRLLVHRLMDDLSELENLQAAAPVKKTRKKG